MKNRFTRRDFLKLAGLLPISIAAPRFVNTLSPLRQSGKPQNVIIIVFDAFSAHNISLYGYQRETTPNLSRLAERAVVYHNHYAGGNFTTPGTASLLTGTLPWTHRAFHHRETVEDSFVSRNIFAAFRHYYRLAYSHNPLLDVYLEQFRESLTEWIPRNKLFLSNDILIPTLFGVDEDIATVSWVRAIKNKEEGYAYSLIISHLYEKFREKKVEALEPQFPRGIPYIAGDNYFLLEDAIDWLRENLAILSQPFMGYFHLMPPHAPYSTHRDFYDYFKNDSLILEHKPLDSFFSDRNFRFDFTAKKQTNYDEYILYVDREFGRLFDYLDSSGILKNTWVILTSDHGEMFERGIIGHKTPVLYEPVIHIPLMIFEPGRKTCLDVHTPTSAIDVLPTILQVTGHPPADWVEGIVLPPFSDPTLAERRNIYVLEAKKNDKYAPLTIATVALIKEGYKIMFFFGYEELGLDGERIELYDIETDPEEMNDLYDTKRETASEMLHELKTKLKEVNSVYEQA